MKGLILLAEDESGIAVKLTRFLEKKGYLVQAYNDGRKLVDDIKDGLKYQLAVVDLSFPYVDGHEIIRLSKKVNPSVPVISASGYDFKPQESDTHLTKPYGFDELEEILGKLLETDA